MVTFRQCPVTRTFDLLNAAMVTSTSGDAVMLTSAVPLVWMYLFVVASRECLPRPSASTVIGFNVVSSPVVDTWKMCTPIFYNLNEICNIACHPVVEGVTIHWNSQSANRSICVIGEFDAAIVNKMPNKNKNVARVWHCFAHVVQGRWHHQTIRFR